LEKKRTVNSVNKQKTSRSEQQSDSAFVVEINMFQKLKHQKRVIGKQLEA
jgi:hypothetical protein